MATPIIRLIAESVEDFGDSLVYSLGVMETSEARDGFALIFSITEPDEDGDGYCVVAEPGQRTAYRAVTRCELVGKELHLTFTPSAATDLAIPRDLVLRLAVTDDEAKILERGLSRVGIGVAERFANDP